MKIILVLNFHSEFSLVWLNVYDYAVGKLNSGAEFTNGFCHNQNLIESSYCCNSNNNHQITTTLCTCHDSTFITTCVKLCSDHPIGVEYKQHAFSYLNRVGNNAREKDSSLQRITRPSWTGLICSTNLKETGDIYGIQFAYNQLCSQPGIISHFPIETKWIKQIESEQWD